MLIKIILTCLVAMGNIFVYLILMLLARDENLYLLFRIVRVVFVAGIIWQCLAAAGIIKFKPAK